MPEQFLQNTSHFWQALGLDVAQIDGAQSSLTAYVLGLCYKVGLELCLAVHAGTYSPLNKNGAHRLMVY